MTLTPQRRNWVDLPDMICRDFYHSGRCGYGQRCTYWHCTPEELPTLNDVVALGGDNLLIHVPGIPAPTQHLEDRESPTRVDIRRSFCVLLCSTCFSPPSSSSPSNLLRKRQAQKTGKPTLRHTRDRLRVKNPGKTRTTERSMEAHSRLLNRPSTTVKKRQKGKKARAQRSHEMRSPR